MCKHCIFLKQYIAAAHFSGRVNTTEFAKALKENITSDGNYRTVARHEEIDLSVSLCIGRGRSTECSRANGVAGTLAFRLLPAVCAHACALKPHV